MKIGQFWVDPEKTRVQTYPVSVEKIQDEVQEETPVIDEESGRV